jgi:putative membrane protein
MKIAIALVSLVLSPFACGATFGDTPSIGNPAGLAPDTPGVLDAHPDPNHMNAADHVFLHEASIGGNAEVAAGHLATRRTRNADVKNLASRLVADHSSAASRLAIAAGRERVSSDKLDADHQVVMDQLGKVNEQGFDEAYVRSQVVEHQNAVQLYEWIISNGQDSRIKSYAIENLPVLFSHLRMVMNLQAILTGSAP